VPAFTNYYKILDLGVQDRNYEPIFLDSLITEKTDPLNEESAKLIVKLILADLENSLTLEADHQFLKKTVAQHDSIARSWNGNLVVAVAVMALQDVIDYGALLAPASNEGPLCGVRALATALHTVRLRLQSKEVQSDELLKETTPDRMLEVLFEEDGALTGVWSRYLRVNITADGRRRRDLQPELAVYTVTSNLGIQHPTAVLQLFFQAGDLDREFALGIVTKGHQIVHNSARRWSSSAYHHPWKCRTAHGLEC
jgi:hypothetical protein